MWFVPWVGVLKLGAVIYRPYEADGVTRYWAVAGPWFKTWTPENQIPKACTRALVASEDMNFWDHWGIDPENIKRAMERNERKGKIRYGASTITQQLVKNLFLARDKSYLRKSREILGALLLDPIMSKRDQLTWYFNVVEFGPKIYGIQAAAKAYFGKKPQNLNAHECATLVTALPSPVRSFKAVRAGLTSAWFESRRSRILERILK